MQGPISRAQIREDLKALGYTKISIRTHMLVRNRAKVYVQKDGVELVGDHNVYSEDYFQAAQRSNTSGALPDASWPVPSNGSSKETTMSPTYIAALYRGSRWSVLDCKTRVFYFIGQSKTFCEQRARELNVRP